MDVKKPLITININRITIDLGDTETDLQSLQRLIDELNDSIGNWLDFERRQQRTCRICKIHYRTTEQHDLDHCPYCNNVIPPRASQQRIDITSQYH
jgi:hypothetical protein